MRFQGKCTHSAHTYTAFLSQTHADGGKKNTHSDFGSQTRQDKNSTLFPGWKKRKKGRKGKKIV